VTTYKELDSDLQKASQFAMLVRSNSIYYLSLLFDESLSSGVFAASGNSGMMLVVL